MYKAIMHRFAHSAFSMIGIVVDSGESGLGGGWSYAWGAAWTAYHAMYRMLKTAYTAAGKSLENLDEMATIFEDTALAYAAKEGSEGKAKVEKVLADFEGAVHKLIDDLPA